MHWAMRVRVYNIKSKEGGAEEQGQGLGQEEKRGIWNEQAWSELEKKIKISATDFF